MARKASAASALIERLNTMVAALISENRKLRREAVKLTERAASAAPKTAKRGARTITRRVKKVAVAKKSAKAKPAIKRKPAPARTSKKKTSPRGTRRSGR
jgi:regulator of replication initiation timing